MESPLPRKLLILDIDSTLVWAETTELKDYDTVLWLQDETLPVWVKKRPHVDELIEYIFTEYDIAVFSAGEYEYVRAVCRYLFVDRPLVFIMSAERCTLYFTKQNLHSRITIKKLQKVWVCKKYKNKYRKNNTLILDDTAETYIKNHGNAIPIASYYGGKKDIELPRIILLLKTLVGVYDVRRVNKGN